MIYLDYSANTPADPTVLDAFFIKIFNFTNT